MEKYYVRSNCQRTRTFCVNASSVFVRIRVFHALQEEDIQFLYNENTAKQSDNIMDKWIQSFTQSLIQFFKAEMDGEEKTPQTHTLLIFLLLSS